MPPYGAIGRLKQEVDHGELIGRVTQVVESGERRHIAQQAHDNHGKL
jgi:hypothetical protein